jgi:type IV secretory pathway VirB2 component (pilin)
MMWFDMEHWVYFCFLGVLATFVAQSLCAQKMQPLAVKDRQNRTIRNRLMLFLPAVFSFFAVVSPADAANVFGVAITQGNDVLEKSIPILKSLAVLGMLGVGGMAMTGRMPWSWAFALIGGLSLLSVAMYTRDWIEYINANATSTGKFEDVANTLTTTNSNLADDAKSLLYTAAAVSIISVGILGIFGKFRWSWIFATTAGMAIIATAVSFVDVFVGTGK